MEGDQGKGSLFLSLAGEKSESDRRIKIEIWNEGTNLCFAVIGCRSHQSE